MATCELYQDSDQFYDLPQVIIFEILSRLPVKSLLKFRCVCKTWLSLISTSQFINTHLQKSTNSNNTNHNLILDTYTDIYEYYTCSLSSLLNDYNTNSIKFTELDFPMLSPFFSFFIVGSFRGLLCLVKDPDILFVYNPSTKKFKKLPLSGTDTNMCFSITYGFGYDELNDDYKVVELCSFFIRSGSIRDTDVKVYSLRNNSWKKLKNHPDGPVRCCSSTFVCGKLHWETVTKDVSFGIVALDMVTEEYFKVVQPKYKDGKCSLSLMELSGCLGVHAYYHEIRIDLWVMKEYGVEESWTKLVSLPYTVELRFCFCGAFESGNGHIVLNYGHLVMLYDPKDGTFETREIQRNGESLSVKIHGYVESLVPPCFDELSMEKF